MAINGASSSEVAIDGQILPFTMDVLLDRILPADDLDHPGYGLRPFPVASLFLQCGGPDGDRPS